MNILLVGGNTGNKGAYLMVLAAYKQAKLVFPESNIILSPIIGNKELLIKFGFKLLNFPLFHVGSDFWFNNALRFPFLVKKYYKLKKGVDLSGEIKLNSIDLVLDISGYAFSDKFGSAPIVNLKKQVDLFHKLGAKYVLLPQALGEFNKSNGQLMKQAIENVDLVFARDSISQQNMHSLVENDSKTKIKKAYDITLSFDPGLVQIDDLNIIKSYITIVPNVQMIKKASSSWKVGYNEAVKKCIELLLAETDDNILLLIHSEGGGGDEKIVRDIFKTFKTEARVKIYQNDDPLVLKSVLKKSKFLIGSRFHALASALSSNTPSIATSWAHKYEMLLSDYGVGEYSFAELNDSFYDAVIRLSSNQELERIKEILDSKSTIIKKENMRMWDLIKSIVN